MEQTERSEMSAHTMNKMEQTERSEMSAHTIQTSGNHPKERIKHSEHSEILKTRTLKILKKFNIQSQIQWWMEH